MTERSSQAGAPVGVASRAFGRVVSGANSLGALWVLALMIIINADILARWLLNAPIPGVAEFVGMSITGIVFMQLAHALRAGRFIRSDASTVLYARYPSVGRVLSVAFNALGAGLFAIIAVVSWPSFRAAWYDGLFVGAIGSVTIPTWPILLIIVVGSAAVMIQYLLFIWSDLTDRSQPASHTQS